MDSILFVFWGLTIAAYGVITIVHPAWAKEGLSSTGDMLLQALPWMIVSMLGAGLVSQFINPAAIARRLGHGTGLVGIVLGAALGVMGTGSRWAVYPLASSLLAADAKAGAVFAFLTSWQLVSLPRLPAEIPFLGLNFTIIRAMVSFTVAVIGGFFIDLLSNFVP